MTPKITLNWGKAAVTASSQMQIAYLMIDIALPAATRPPVDLCLILDRSASMDGPKLSSVKEAACLVVDQLGPEDTISVVAFETESEVIVRPTSVRDSRGIKRQIRRMEAGVATCLGLGMTDGLEQLARVAKPGRLSAALILTDGAANDEGRAMIVAEQFGAQKVLTRFLGFGEGWKQDFLEHLAKLAGGLCEYVEHPADAAQAFGEFIAKAKATVAQNAVLSLSLVNGVEPRTIYRLTPMIRNIGYRPSGTRTIDIPVGDLETGIPNLVLVEFLLPPRQVGEYRIAKLELGYDPIGGRPVSIDPISVMITYNAVDGAFNPKVMNWVEKATAFKLQTRALSMTDPAMAAQTLQNAATRLLNAGEVDAAHQTRKLSEQLMTGTLDEAARRRADYSTRRIGMTARLA